MPTVSWRRADAVIGGSTPPITMQALIEVLKEQGWTVEYADANAIGTGSASSPKFDTVAYSSGASIGVVVVKMPLNGLSTAWLVRIEPKWGTNASGWLMVFATGTGRAGGVLSDPGTTLTVGSSSSTASNNLEYFISAHKNEMMVCFPAYSAVQIGRFRTLGGTSLDDIVILITTNYSAYVAGLPAPVFNISPNAGVCITRNVSQGEYTASRALVWGHSTGATYYAGASTMTDFAGNYGYPVGPFLMGNGPGGFPRLMAFFPTGDIPAALQNFTVTVDGADRLFFVPTGTGGLSLSGARWAFAKE